jgi:hypothetical protein
LNRLTELLLERETVDGADVDSILNPPPPVSPNGLRVVRS